MHVKTPARRCKAMTAASGYREQCRNFPVNGTSVCRMHGAGAPQVKRKAAERMRDLVDPLIGVLEKAIQQVEDRKLYLHPTVVRLATLVFDRAGLHPKVELEVEDNRGSKTWLGHTTGPERAMLVTIMTAGQGRERGENVPCVMGSRPPRPKLVPPPVEPEPDEVVL